MLLAPCVLSSFDQSFCVFKKSGNQSLRVAVLARDEFGDSCLSLAKSV